MDIEIPRTPTPQSTSKDERTTNNPKLKADAALDDQTRNLTTTPPPPPNTSLTPPPSSQVPRPSALHLPQSRGHVEQTSLTSPPATLKTIPSAHLSVAPNDFPTVDQVNELSEQQLRNLLHNLLPALGEARMSIAHAKLQYNLLSIEAKEAAERAAVEHDMTLREVEVLQAGSPILRNRASTWTETRSPEFTIRQVELTLKRSRQLETENLRLEHRLRQAKKIIRHLDGKNSQLQEDSHLLRQRIKQNRDHIDAMQSSGILTPCPVVQQTPKTFHRILTKSTGGARTGGQDPFDALLFAGQVLNGETTSVPSTPTHLRHMKSPLSHTRGAHSLSSLPITPDHSRPLTADNVLYTPTNRGLPSSQLSFSAPGNKFLSHDDDRRRKDRDSTISASDNEEAYTDEDVPASQASQIATSMLRRYSESTSLGTQVAIALSEEKPLIRSILGSKITKPKRSKGKNQEFSIIELNSPGEDVRASKKVKLGDASERLGLGIGMWPSPS